MASYAGRFAPSPTGPLHAGSLVAALASWLDARAHNGRWLVRIEDVDTPRCVPGAAETILNQLARCGLLPDDAPVWQSQRGALYQAALDSLIERRLAYPCTCSRKAIAEANAARGVVTVRGLEAIYPGTCRPSELGESQAGKIKLATAQVAWRLHTEAIERNHHIALAGIQNIAINSGAINWSDRRLGSHAELVSQVVGDFVLRRADQLWAYQLAVVVDDAAQGVTDVVRGEDLASNTARQILLQHALGLSTPRYLHTPLVLGENGEKLSKQNGAAPLVLDPTPLPAVRTALRTLGLPVDAAALTGHHRVADWLHWAVQAWSDRYPCVG